MVFGFSTQLDDGRPTRPGQRVRLAGEIENRLVPGRYDARLLDPPRREQRRHGACSASGCSTSSSSGRRRATARLVRRRRARRAGAPANDDDALEPTSEAPARDAPARDAAELRDVPGPSALGGGWRRFVELLYLIAVNDFKRTYFGTVLGYLWTLARPLMLFGVLLAVFTQVFRIGSEVPHYPVLLLFNIVLFGFFQEATGIAVISIVGQEGVVRKTQFPRLVIPLAVVLTSLFNLALNLIVVFVFILAFGVEPDVDVAAVPGRPGAADHHHHGGLHDRRRRCTRASATWRSSGRSPRRCCSTRRRSSTRSTRCPRACGDIILLNPLAPLFELARKWMIDPDRAGPGRGARAAATHLLAPAAIFVGDLRPRRVGPQPRGAPDRRGAVIAGAAGPAWRGGASAAGASACCSVPPAARHRPVAAREG